MLKIAEEEGVLCVYYGCEESGVYEKFIGKIDEMEIVELVCGKHRYDGLDAFSD